MQNSGPVFGLEFCSRIYRYMKGVFKMVRVFLRTGARIPYGEILRVYTIHDGKTVIIEVEEDGNLQEIEYERNEIERVEIRL